jgi:succinate dehydrogenase / fumarate reductase cytochrome b subunit
LNRASTPDARTGGHKPEKLPYKKEGLAVLSRPHVRGGVNTLFFYKGARTLLETGGVDAVSQLSAFLKSSIGRKALMAVTGLLLIGFLITHVSANMLLLFDHDAFNSYSHKLISNPLIYIAEIGLLGLFVAHLAAGILTELGNRKARPIAYGAKQNAGGTSRKSLASSTMIFSGVLALLFVPLHIWGFKFGAYYDSATHPGTRDLARLVVEEFQNPFLVGWYVFAMVILGFHAFHGIGSAFESLGVSLNQRAWLKNGGRALALLIFAGFTIIPIGIHFFMGGAS